MPKDTKTKFGYQDLLKSIGKQPVDTQKNSEEASEYFILVNILYNLRAQRDTLPFNKKRMAYNKVCDSLDVLISKVHDNSLLDGEEENEVK